MNVFVKKQNEKEVVSDDSFKLLERTLSKLEEKYELTSEEILNLIEKQKKQIIQLPISIFQNDSLSALETISKYLKENLKMRFCEIAFVLNRDDRTVWDAYSSSQQKMPESLRIEDSKYSIPVYIFRERNVAVLEVLTEFLKDECNLRFCQIAALLNRDDRTIWTVYQRIKKKRHQ
jgi:hypothetical protein